MMREYKTDKRGFGIGPQNDEACTDRSCKRREVRLSLLALSEIFRAIDFLLC